MNAAEYFRNFFLRNGTALGTFLLVAVAFWVFYHDPATAGFHVGFFL